MYNFGLPGLGDVRMAAVWIVAPVCGSGLMDDLLVLGQEAIGDGAGRTRGARAIRCPLPMALGRHVPIILEEQPSRDQSGSGHNDRLWNATDGLSSGMGGGEAAPAVA